MKLLFLSLLFLTSLKAEMTTFLLIRHGETEANRTGITSGWSDVRLSEEGRMQAAKLADTLFETHPDIAAIYSSDLTRAYDTAKPTADYLELPITRRFALREMNFGDGEGCSKEERERYLSLWKSWDEPIYPNGETYNELIARVRGELAAIAKEHPGQKVAIFSHGRAIQAVIASASGYIDFPIIGNCQILTFVLTVE